MTEPKADSARPSVKAEELEIARMSFEDAMAELDKIVRQIEEGRGQLDDAIAAYERGIALKRHCEAKLREAEARIEKITVTPAGAEGSGLTVSLFDSR